MQQLLLTHRPDLEAQQWAELKQQVAAAGCHAAGLVPEHTVLLMGPPGAAAALAPSTHVMRVVSWPWGPNGVDLGAWQASLASTLMATLH